MSVKSLLLTHDLSCVIGQLAVAAQRFPEDGRVADLGDRRVHALAVAAVAFTIQLAIDEGGCDPTEMRALESELIAKLEAHP